MKHCPACEGARHYRLSDGRYKCRACGHRFSWTSAWDSVRLPNPVKQQLLELFVLGLPSYRQRFRSPVSAAARERFYRLLRAPAAPRSNICASRSTARWNSTKPPLEDAQGQARLGCGGQGDCVWDHQAQWPGQGYADPGTRPHFRHAANRRAHPRGGALLHRRVAVLRHAEAARRARDDPQGEGPAGRARPQSTASKASGATPRTGCILTAACPANTSIFTWAKFATVTTTRTKTSNPCL